MKLLKKNIKIIKMFTKKIIYNINITIQILFINVDKILRILLILFNKKI